MRTSRYSHEKLVAIIATAATIALTAIAFWLSYEHLQEVARTNGLGGDSIRAWAWPATVDLFIVIGELLVLLGSLKGQRDWFGYTITAVGSLGSIALNVAGVGREAQALEYVVAAVPPVAALLAFAALMRQVHKALHQSSPELQAATHLLESIQALDLPPLEPQEVPQMPTQPPLPALESMEEDHRPLVERLLELGGDLPGRKTVMDMYGVSEWDARTALREAREELEMRTGQRALAEG